MLNEASIPLPNIRTSTKETHTQTKTLTNKKL